MTGINKNIAKVTFTLYSFYLTEFPEFKQCIPFFEDHSFYLSKLNLVS